MNIAARFFARIASGQDFTECWTWGGRPTTGGYGRFTANKRWFMAHRWAYEHLVGDVPEGLVLDHLCRNRLCVNPWHLEPVTTAENLRRGRTYQLAKTHCPHNHPYDEANTYVDPDGHRECRTCRAERSLKNRPRTLAYLREYRAKKRAQRLGSTAPNT